MSLFEDSPGVTGLTTRRLRRISGNPRILTTQTAAPIDVIEKNLEPLKQNTKKIFAQEIYYQNNPEHQSPLMRVEKGPVHQRLGVRQRRLKRIVPLGTNTSSVLPKKRTLTYSRPPHNMQIGNAPGNFKRRKLQRIYSAQARIERIRAQHRNSNRSPIKLRRLTPGLPPATNLTVQVKNPNFHAEIGSNFAAKFKMVLDSEIQAEIREIQREGSGSICTIPPTSTITPTLTGISTNDRFSLL